MSGDAAAVLYAILAEIRGLRADMRELRSLTGDRDPESPLLRELATYYGNGEWTLDELKVDAEDDESLGVAVAAVGVGRLGVTLRGLRDRPHAGLRLIATGLNRRKVTTWRVLTEISPSTPRIPQCEACEPAVGRLPTTGQDDSP